MSTQGWDLYLYIVPKCRDSFSTTSSPLPDPDEQDVLSSKDSPRAERVILVIFHYKNHASIKR